MAAFRTKYEDLPAEFALFPLPGALLLPHGRLPLNIFESRYVAMVEDSMKNGRMFAMIQPDPSLPETPHGPGLYRIGCLGRVSSFQETDDGRFLISLTGLSRFSIASEIDMRHGYRQAIGDFSRFKADMNPPDDPDVDRAAILEALKGYFTHRGVDANWDAINRLSDDQLVTTLATACPFEPIEKQALLEAPSEPERAETLLALLRMGAAEPDGASGHTVS